MSGGEGMNATATSNAVMIGIPGHPGWLAVFCPPGSVEVFKPDGTGRRYTRKHAGVTLSSVALDAVRDMLEDKND